MSPVRLKLRRTARFNLQDASRAVNGLPARSCARPGPLGNPFGWQTPQLSDHSGRSMAVRQHREWLIEGRVPHSHRKERAELLAKRERVIAMMPDLAATNLACWCRPDQRCHVDTLLAIAAGRIACK
jgi:hypothetical protein